MKGKGPINLYARAQRKWHVWCLTAVCLLAAMTAAAQERPVERLWPDGSLMDPWFKFNEPYDGTYPGKIFEVTDHGVVKDSTVVQTAALQRVIDEAAATGRRATVVIPQGTFLTGSLFMRQGVNLFMRKGAVLKGSDNIADYPVVETRIEGQTCKYFAALINADGLDGWTMAGAGTIDGNGLRFWQAFWLRRQWNPQCTNKDEQRPRLVYVSNSKNVEISGLTLQNSPFWTCHLYKCQRVKLLNLRILAPHEPVKAPSSDAVDIDVCQDVLISHCYMNVNDDAVALKGGKGVEADKDPANGANERILIEDCEYGFCHSCLTCGSESVHNRNVILRRTHVDQATRLLWLKMRPDTPQHYEHILVEDVWGSVTHFLYIHPWTQFFDLQGRKDIVKSRADHITMRKCRLACKTQFNVERSDQYSLSDFTFEYNELEVSDGGQDGRVFFDTNEQGEVTRQ